MFLFLFQTESVAPPKPAGRISTGEQQDSEAEPGPAASPFPPIQRGVNGKLRSEGQSPNSPGSGGWLGTGLDKFHLHRFPLWVLWRTRRRRGASTDGLRGKKRADNETLWNTNSWEGQMKATGSMNYPGDKAKRQEYGSHTGHRGEPGGSGAAGRGEARRAGPGGGGPARGGAGPHFLSPGGVGAAVGPWPGARSRVPPRRWSGS